MNDKDTKLLMEVYEKSIKNPSDYMQGIAKSFMSGQGDVLGRGTDFMQVKPEAKEQTIDGIPYEEKSALGERDVIKVVNAYAIPTDNVEVPPNYLESLPDWMENASEQYKKDTYIIMKWVKDHDAYYFGHGKDESGYFPLDQGIREAIKAGKKIIVYENLS